MISSLFDIVVVSNRLPLGEKKAELTLLSASFHDTGLGFSLNVDVGILRTSHSWTMPVRPAVA
jgi:hypothetical protein